MVKEIPLSKGYVALVDDEDFELVSGYKWYAQVLKGVVYAASRKDRLFMHRLILAVEEELLVDHINHNGLDNRRINLRAATKSQNNANQRTRLHTSRFKGVCLFVDKRSGWTRWMSQITVNKKNIHLGYFKVEEEAARVYNEAALRHFGEYALINIIEGVS